ncbi:hypothetical protein WJ0W_005360 [Paenibacillus melissococcoides]|uniref:Uncharacterized protein n=1 Tax=Paenibacillus melissococcoides TaxID=2912268 RepID=A0ABN8UE76_9BACL|nr:MULTISPECIES: hypothetical protein [Paenibacillus]MEB9896463.1 hypothetical protein [Bacillus cereus]CAH8248105.1 hypothetical protein WJ0W_005360 [Paenibacillus melissococcoides]CAH8718462.1 hypothetical protein HTL2_005286 [Paenibacillus melissococcoides]CAH8718656.1 hypothetical protein WDD9_005288 [Paenibacillus melissococcoides]
MKKDALILEPSKEALYLAVVSCPAVGVHRDFDPFFRFPKHGKSEGLILFYIKDCTFKQGYEFLIL